MTAESWTHQFVTANEVELHYVTQGEGPLMLMLHGFPEFWYSWRHQIPEFARRYKVVALDMRGYNESEKPPGVEAYRPSEVAKDVAEVVRALGYEQCTLVGHDWGGAIAWNVAYDYSARVERLVVMNIPHPSLGAKALQNPQQLLRSWYIFLFQLPGLPELLLSANDHQLIGQMLSETVVNQQTFTPEDIVRYRQAVAHPGALTAMVNYYRNIFSLNSDRRGVLDIPALMIWGEEDVALGKELTYGTERYVRDFQIRYIPGCGHWVQNEQPELVNQYMWEFLDQA
ncbi:MAG: alpha/beta hydrolase [Cyanobacteria bacterium P01_A01_bin.135]